MAWLSIDLNGILSGRSERQRKKLRGELVNVCPHMKLLDLDIEDGLKLHIQPMFETFVGTVIYYCQGCGLQQSDFGISQMRQDWSRSFDADPKAMIDDYFWRVKERNKIVEKLNRYGGAQVRIRLLIRSVRFIAYRIQEVFLSHPPPFGTGGVHQDTNGSCQV